MIILNKEQRMVPVDFFVGYAECDTCKRRIQLEDKRVDNINFYLRNSGWVKYQTECIWKIICSKCDSRTGIDPDDEYDNLKDNELSLASNDSQ